MPDRAQAAPAAAAPSPQKAPKAIKFFPKKRVAVAAESSVAEQLSMVPKAPKTKVLIGARARTWLPAPRCASAAPCLV